MTTGNVRGQTVGSDTKVWLSTEADHLSSLHSFITLTSIMSEHIGSQDWINEAAWLKTSL